MMTIMQGKKASGFTPSGAEVTGKNISAIAHDGPGTGMTQNQEQGTCHHDLWSGQFVSCSLAGRASNAIGPIGHR